MAKTETLKPCWLAFFAFCFFLSSGIKAQQVDSLLSVLSAEISDTVKVKTFLQLGQAFESIDFDSALYYYNEGLELAQHIREEHPFFKGLVLEHIGIAHYRQGNRELLRAYLKMSMKSHETEGLDEEWSRTEHRLATYYANFSMYDSAVHHFDQIVARNKANGTTIEMATSLSSSGLNSYYLRNLDKAAESLLEAIRYSQSTGDTARIYAPFLNYGLVLKEQGQYESAKDYMRMAQEKFINKNLTKGIALAYTNIGQVLILQDSLDAAFDSFTKARVYQKKLGWSDAGYYSEIASIEKKRGNYEKYHEYATEAVKVRPPSAAPKTIADGLANLVEAKLMLADAVFLDFSTERKRLMKEALPYAEKAWHLADSVNSGNVKLRVANALTQVLANLEMYKEAFEFSQISKKLSEEINDKSRTEAIARMTTEFETEKVQNENALLLESQRVQTAQLRQQQYLLIIGLVILVVIIGFTVLIQHNRRKLQKANQTIQNALDEKDLLLKEIHHRVKNNLQVVSSLLDLQSRDINDEQALSTFMEGQNRVKAMALIHQKLYQNEDLSTIDFKEYAENLMKELSAIYPTAKGVQSEITSGDNTHFDIDTAVPLGLILNELISNAFKYAFNENKEGQLSIKMETIGEGKHRLTVSDTGPGLPTTFDFTKAKSLGLKLVRRLAKQLYGSVTYSKDQGSRFVITFTDTLLRKAV